MTYQSLPFYSKAHFVVWYERERERLKHKDKERYKVKGEAGDILDFDQHQGSTSVVAKLLTLVRLDLTYTTLLHRSHALLTYTSKPS